ncbi:MAG: hypothetical protein JNK15_03845 [Planctomycetes bacterium]|nr:hypothetical protein [Planctomycetota bacterium]
MTPAEFGRSLDGAAPSTGLPAALLGCWHALRGEWERAHDAVQPDDADCAWVHAALHREEGDQANAAYWYRVAARTPGTGPARDEYLAIAVALLARV